MAYSNGIFRLDYVNGSNAARSALTSVAVTENATKIRCTKAGHGLVTGAVVTASAFTTTAYNTTHIVNRIDDDIFELFSSRATGTITVTGTPIADETFVVGAQTFTFKASRGGAGQVTISSDNVEQAKNICYAIMTDIPTSVIAFVGTRLQPSNQYTVTIDNLDAGTAGNSTVLTESATGITVSGAGTLSGGAQVSYSANDSGTITPFGGQSWADAWQDITSGATAARIAPGDTVLIAKSSDPIGCANAAFTDLSKTVTLQALTSCTFADNGSGGVRVTKADHNIYDSAIVTVSLSTDYNGNWPIDWISSSTFDLVGATYVADRSGTVTPAFTKVVDLCETAWTPLNSASVTRQAVATDAKEGSYCMQITAPASPATATEYAYYAISSTDFSLYDKLTFWIKNEVAVLATHWKICLCSDNAGATIVDTFEIPAIPSTGQWVPLTIARTGGGKLGNAIQSIALWSATVAPTASKYLRVDCFNAATTVGLNQQSMISKSSLARSTYTSGLWYCLQSINGNTLLIDNDVNCLATAGRGYTGTSETVACYLRETIKTSLASASSTVIQEVQDSGSATLGNILFLGGFNTSTSIQDGTTFFDGLNGFGYGIQLSSKVFITLFCLGFFRYYSSVIFVSTVYNLSIEMECGHSTYHTFSGSLHFSRIVCLKLSNSGSAGSLFYGNAFRCSVWSNVIAIGGLASGLYFASTSNTIDLKTVTSKNNAVYGLQLLGSGNSITDLITAGNTSGAIAIFPSNNYLYNPSLSESIKVVATNYQNANLFITKYAGDVNDNRVYSDGAYCISQTSIKHGSSAIGWQVFITSVTRTVLYKFRIKIGVVGVTTTDKAITCTAWVKKSHGTDIEASIYVPGGQIAGVTSDVESAVAGNDTGDVQLTLSFTPTKKGVVEVFANVWWLANTADENAVFSDFGYSQAT